MPTFREDLHLGHKTPLIETDDIIDGAVTGDKIAPGVIESAIEPYVNDLQNQIDSLNDHGVSVSNEFGDNPHISISQKTLTEDRDRQDNLISELGQRMTSVEDRLSSVTDAINRLWQKLEDITGETLRGISMTVTPDSFHSEDGCDVRITASTTETNGIFEHIAFYANDVLIAEYENTDAVQPLDHHIDDTTVFTCVAKILGNTYTRHATVTNNNA